MEFKVQEGDIVMDEATPDTEVLLNKIMAVIQETPTLDKGYWCHEQWHEFHPPDYETIKLNIMRILTDERQRSTRDA